jgi:hypothetical protein
MLIADLPTASSERMNSPPERREVRLRGLGGQAARGVPGTGPSAPIDEIQSDSQAFPIR